MTNYKFNNQYNSYNSELALKYLQDLIKFDSSYTGDREAKAIEYVENILKEAGIKTEKFELEPGRPNLLATIEGTNVNKKDGLILSSHIDVVPAGDSSAWKYPPFSGCIAEDCVWGRGTLDMKFKTAFDLSVMLHYAKNPPKNNLQMIVLSDEERGGDCGAKYFMKVAQDKLIGHFIFNELGGFNLEIAGKKLFPIQVAERTHAQIKIILKQNSEHTALTLKKSLIEILGEFFPLISENFNKNTVITEMNRPLFEAFSSVFNITTVEELVRKLEKLSLENHPLAKEFAMFSGMFFTRAIVTKITAGDAVNRLPESCEVDIDFRIQPDIDVKELFKKFKSIFTEFIKNYSYVNFEFIGKDDSRGYLLDYTSNDYNKFATIFSNTLKSLNTEGEILPYMMPAATDNSTYAKYGFFPLGFLPVFFDKDFPGFSLIHGANERIPIHGFFWGLACYQRVVDSFLADV